MVRLKYIQRISVLYFFILSFIAEAQPQEKYIKVLVAPDHANWTYKTGENCIFTISVFQNNVPVKNAELRYEIMPDMMEPIKKESVTLKDGTLKVNAGSMKVPGFLRCKAYAKINGKEYSGAATAAFDPLKIKPTTEVPSDFIAFWNNNKEEAAKVPLDIKMTLLPDRCTEKVKVYHVNFQNSEPGSRFYGILCIPSKPGKYPAILKVPGAGVRPYGGDIGTAEKGIITFEVGIHGVPVNMEASVYQSLGNGPLRGYPTFNLDSKENYYYKRVYMGCVRAVDVIFSLPEFDQERVAVTGGSQGGALSIVTAALDPRVKWLVSYYPALCDHTGYLNGRAGGWPHMFSDNNKKINVKDDKVLTSKYYDVVNFARLLKIPGYYSWGYNDEVCPPTSMYSAYNVIEAPKNLFIAAETGHWTFPEQHEITNKWLMEQMNVEDLK